MREPSNYKLLVIDDEPALVRLIKTYLSRLGYQVEAYCDGTQAWAAFEQDPSAYDLVIADLSMPDIDIEGLLPSIPALNRRVRVLVCSGRAYEVKALPRPIQQHFSFLQKPFVPKMLAAAVQETLSRACVLA